MKTLLATDGSEFGFAAARKCCEIIENKEGTSIRIVNVMETLTPVEPFGMSDEYIAIARTATREVAMEIVEDTRQIVLAILGETEMNVESKILSGKPNQSIVEEAERWGADLIVMGSQGRGFWGRMFLGSVSNAVVRHASCSVLVVREKVQAENNKKHGVRK